MFDDILKWVTLFAACATLYAVLLAHKTWKSWKAQQEHIVKKEKLIENEINIIGLYYFQGNEVKQFIDMKALAIEKRTNRLSKEDDKFFRTALDYIHSKVIELEINYGLCLELLTRYGLEISKELKLDLFEFRKFGIDFQDKIFKCDNLDDLNVLKEDYYNQATVRKDHLLNALKDYRENVLK